MWKPASVQWVKSVGVAAQRGQRRTGIGLAMETSIHHRLPFRQR